MRNNKRTKRLQCTPTSDNILVSGSATCARLYSGKLRCNDVVWGASIGGAHLKPDSCQQYPGNQRYLAILRKHHEPFLQATGFDRRLIVNRVVDETKKADPPARFIARGFGFQQWLGMNDDAVVKMIQHDLLHNLTVAKTAKEPNTIKHQSEQYEPHKRAMLARTVSPVGVLENENDDVDTTDTTIMPTEHVAAPPAVVSCNVSELLQLPCMAAERSRLSDYTQFLLSSIELFQATELDVATSRKGRLTLGQLGLRCRYCARARAPPLSYSASFPGRLAVMEFNYFLIAGKHYIGGACVHIPPELRSRMLTAKRISQSQTKRRGGTGIQAYFNQVARLCGIQNTSHGGLKLPSTPRPPKDTVNAETNKGPSNAQAFDAGTTNTSSQKASNETKEAMILADVHTSITKTSAAHSSFAQNYGIQVSPEETKKAIGIPGMTE